MASKVIRFRTEPRLLLGRFSVQSGGGDRMLPENDDLRGRASRYRERAARLRAVAEMATGFSVEAVYVEELAREFDGYADALEHAIARTAPLAE